MFKSILFFRTLSSLNQFLDKLEKGELKETGGEVVADITEQTELVVETPSIKGGEKESTEHGAKVGREDIGGVEVILGQEREMPGDGEFSSGNIIKFPGDPRVQKAVIPAPKRSQDGVMKYFLGRKGRMTGQRLPIPGSIQMLTEDVSM